MRGYNVRVSPGVTLRAMAQGQPSTFSICVADPATGEVGVAVQSKYFSVGSVVPWARAGVGAVATQAAGVAVYGPRILDLLEQGLGPDEALDRALANDAGKETRQLGVVTASGTSACWTGADCNAWAGDEAGPGYAAQGNILAGGEVVEEMVRAYGETTGAMTERLVAALRAGQAAGGDKRGQQSAAVYIERSGAGVETGSGIDRVCDLRVEDHSEPIEELARLVEIHLRWEVLTRAFGCHTAGRYAEGVELLAQGLVRFPNDATILYDLACYRALAGLGDGAIESLARALELDPSLKELARGDSDFDSVRERPEFSALV